MPSLASDANGMSLMQAAQTRRSRGGASRDRVASSNRNCSDPNPEPIGVSIPDRYAIIPLTEVSNQAAAPRCRPDFDTARVSRTASRITAF